MIKTMAYLDDEVWNCPKHPLRRPRIGVCPVCLHERLASLCPDCAHARPCACMALPTSSSASSSSSSSFSLLSYSVSMAADFSGGGATGRIGSVGRVASLIESEPAFLRSRSLAIPFPGSGNQDLGSDLGFDRARSKRGSFWRLFNSKRIEDGETEERKRTGMMRKSRSVAVRDFGVSGDPRFSPAKTRAKGKFWYFPSPMKAFRQSRVY